MDPLNRARKAAQKPVSEAADREAAQEPAQKPSLEPASQKAAPGSAPEAALGAGQPEARAKRTRGGRKAAGPASSAASETSVRQGPPAPGGRAAEPRPLPERFGAAMAALDPSWPEGRYVCAFSGGPDSTALLALLAGRLPPDRILAAHLDHRLRGESRDDARRAVALARRLGLTCLAEERDVPALAAERGKGIEEAARSARYGFLEAVRAQWGGDFVVTAHHAEDQAETIVLKLVRGAGPGGLAGVRAKVGRVIRPLLGFGKRELGDWLKGEGLEWIEDDSNADRRFRRNQVRQDVLPALEALNPAYLSAMGRAAELAAAEEDFWTVRLDELEAALAEAEPGGWFSLEAALFNHLTLAERRRLAGRLLRRVELPGRGGGEPVGFQTVEGMLEMAGRPGAGGLDLPGGRRVEWRGRRLRIGPASRFRAAAAGRKAEAGPETSPEASPSAAPGAAPPAARSAGPGAAPAAAPEGSPEPGRAAGPLAEAVNGGPERRPRT